MSANICKHNSNLGELISQKLIRYPLSEIPLIVYGMGYTYGICVYTCVYVYMVTSCIDISLLT